MAGGRGTAMERKFKKAGKGRSGSKDKGKVWEERERGKAGKDIRKGKGVRQILEGIEKIS